MPTANWTRYVLVKQSMWFHGYQLARPWWTTWVQARAVKATGINHRGPRLSTCNPLLGRRTRYSASEHGRWRMAFDAQDPKHEVGCSAERVRKRTYPFERRSAENPNYVYGRNTSNDYSKTLWRWTHWRRSFGRYIEWLAETMHCNFFVAGVFNKSWFFLTANDKTTCNFCRCIDQNQTKQNRKDFRQALLPRNGGQLFFYKRIHRICNHECIKISLDCSCLFAFTLTQKWQTQDHFMGKEDKRKKKTPGKNKQFLVAHGKMGGAIPLACPLSQPSIFLQALAFLNQQVPTENDSPCIAYPANKNRQKK